MTRRRPGVTRLGLRWAVAAVAAVLTAGTAPVSVQPPGAAAVTAESHPVDYGVTPADRHAVPGLRSVRLTAAAAPAPWAKPADPEGELPAWPFAVGAIVAVAVVAIWSVRRRP